MRLAGVGRARAAVCFGACLRVKYFPKLSGRTSASLGRATRLSDAVLRGQRRVLVIAGAFCPAPGGAQPLLPGWSAEASLPPSALRPFLGLQIDTFFLMHVVGNPLVLFVRSIYLFIFDSK